jgi:hypothetical protein
VGRVLWRALLNAAVNISNSVKVREYLEQLKNCELQRTAAS